MSSNQYSDSRPSDHDASRYLIFGGTGFLGRHLCEYLSTKGSPATVISRNPDLNFLASLNSHFDGLTISEFEARQQHYLARAEVIVYLASGSIPGTNQEKPWIELAESVEPAFKLFTNAQRFNPEIRIIYISSGGTIYGGSQGGHFLNEADRPSPISVYGLGKVMIESALSFLGNSTNLNYAILRVSNPIGIWQTHPRQGIVNVAIEKIRKGEELTLFDQGRQVRDFIDADDVAEAIHLAMLDRCHCSAIWNVGAGYGHRIIDIISMIESLVERKLLIRQLPARHFDVPAVVLDRGRILKDLGWEPRTSLNDSIKKVLIGRGVIKSL